MILIPDGPQLPGTSARPPNPCSQCGPNLHTPGPTSGPTANICIPLPSLPGGPPRLDGGFSSLHSDTPRFTCGPPRFTCGPPRLTCGPPRLTCGPPRLTSCPPRIIGGPPSSRSRIHSTPGVTGITRATRATGVAGLARVAARWRPEPNAWGPGRGYDGGPAGDLA